MEYFAHSQKEFVYKYVVMLSDSDQFKHMSFANYLRLMFLATDALFVSMADENFLEKRRLKLVCTRFQFKRQTKAGNNILIKVNSAAAEGSRFSLLYTYLIEGTGDLIGLGRQTFELLDVNSGKAEMLPDGIHHLLGPIRVDEGHLLYEY